MTVIDRIRQDRERQLQQGPPEIAVCDSVRPKMRHPARLVSFHCSLELWSELASLAARQGLAYGHAIERLLARGLIAASKGDL